jgi:tRNA(fMet)-specific endonuclease VapC
VTIGSMDLLIAAHALALDATLVSNNLAHFSRVTGLKTANWK